MSIWRSRQQGRDILSEWNENLIDYARVGDSDGVMQLRHVADVNYINSNDDTALMIASADVERGLPIVKILLDSGADPNIQNNNGDTALLLATWSIERIVMMNESWGIYDETSTKQQRSRSNRMYRRLNLLILSLLQGGANPYHKDNIGETPYDIAMELGHSEIAELLKYYMDIYRIQAFSRGNLTRRKLHTSMARKRSSTSQLGEEYGLGEDIIQMLNSRMTRPTQVDMIDEIPRNMRETLDREPESDEINWEEIFREHPELRPEQSGSGKRKTKKRKRKRKY